VAVDGTRLYVLEYGNQRVQILTPDGGFVASIGRPGQGDGCFASPWRCALARGALFVSDTENCRVVRLESPK
jgi:DNA-binding beta-propeller fold protein YncE